MTDAQLAERSNLAQAALCCVFATAEFGGLHAVAIAATRLLHYIVYLQQCVLTMLTIGKAKIA